MLILFGGIVLERQIYPLNTYIWYIYQDFFINFKTYINTPSQEKIIKKMAPKHSYDHKIYMCIYIDLFNFLCFQKIM